MIKLNWEECIPRIFMNSKKVLYSGLVVAGFIAVVVSFGMICGEQDQELDGSQKSVWRPGQNPSDEPDNASEIFCEEVCSQLADTCNVSSTAKKTIKESCTIGCVAYCSEEGIPDYCQISQEEVMSLADRCVDALLDQKTSTSCKTYYNNAKSGKTQIFSTLIETYCEEEINTLIDTCTPEEPDSDDPDNNSTATDPDRLPKEGILYASTKFYYIALEEDKAEPTQFYYATFKDKASMREGFFVGRDECTVQGISGRETKYEGSFNFGNTTLKEKFTEPPEITEGARGALIKVPDLNLTKITISCTNEKLWDLYPNRAVPLPYQIPVSSGVSAASNLEDCCTSISECQEKWKPIILTTETDLPDSLLLNEMLCEIDKGFELIYANTLVRRETLASAIQWIHVYASDTLEGEAEFSDAVFLNDKLVSQIRFYNFEQPEENCPYENSYYHYSPPLTAVAIHEAAHALDHKFRIMHGGGPWWYAHARHGPCITIYGAIRYPSESSQRPYEDFAETFTLFIIDKDYVREIYDSQEDFYSYVKSKLSDNCYSLWPPESYECSLPGCSNYAGLQKLTILNQFNLITKDQVIDFATKFNWSVCNEKPKHGKKNRDYYYSERCPLIGDWAISTNKDYGVVAKSNPAKQRYCEDKKPPRPTSMKFRVKNSDGQTDLTYNMACYQSGGYYNSLGKYVDSSNMTSCLGIEYGSITIGSTVYPIEGCEEADDSDDFDEFTDYWQAVSDKNVGPYYIEWSATENNYHQMLTYEGLISNPTLIYNDYPEGPDVDMERTGYINVSDATCIWTFTYTALRTQFSYDTYYRQDSCLK